MNTNETSDVTQEQLDSLKPANPVKPKGRIAGYEHLKPMNIEDFIIRNDCVNMLIEHPFIRQLKLVSNPYMYRTYGRANYKTNTVEMSTKAMSEPPVVQREVFIRAVCHFIAKKMFDEHGEGQAYNLLIQRYIKKSRGQSNSTGTIAAEVLETKELETTH